MSKTDKTDFSTPSTVEAIRMASASILGTTTGKGFPLGSAIGSGSMMELNAEEVAMNVTPLVLSIRNLLHSKEGVELLSMEWDLEHPSGSSLLPEQLIIAGSSSKGVSCHVSVLSWENGVVDPFKIDDHMRSIAKKISDIEIATVNNDLEYHKDGVSILKTFNDRFNRVLFVEMMDRRFQGSWDSLQIKSDNVSKESRVRLQYRDDFVMIPPGPKITKRLGLDFVVSDVDEKSYDDLSRWILTPEGLELISVQLPELGRLILKEINTHAYALEELDIVKTMNRVLLNQLGFDNATFGQMDLIRNASVKLVSNAQRASESLTGILEDYVKSGNILNVEEHTKRILEGLARLDSDNEVAALSRGFIEDLERSLKREFGDLDIKAWQMRSAVSYFMTYVNRVISYFSKQLNQYFATSCVRAAYLAALHEFKSDIINDGTDDVDSTIFEKLYAELFAQLNAVMDRESFRSGAEQDFDSLVGIVTRELHDAFGKIDIWDLISFNDVSEIAKSEISRRYRLDGSDSSLDEHGTDLTNILDSLELLVHEVVPDIASTLLGRESFAAISSSLSEKECVLDEALLRVIDSHSEKGDLWLREARNWMSNLSELDCSGQSSVHALVRFFEFIHSKLDVDITAQSMVERVCEEAESRERVYQASVDEWDAECKRIEEHNAPIRESNEKRERMISEAKKTYENEQSEYERAMAEFNARLNSMENSVAPSLTPPSKPKSLESRIQVIDNELPYREQMVAPPKPVPPKDLVHYQEIRDLLTSRLEKMDQRQESMRTIFSERLKMLQNEGTKAAADVKVNLGDAFIEYLMDSAVRSMRNLLPRAKRAYLRDPEDPTFIHLVSFEYLDDELLITIGHTRMG